MKLIDLFSLPNDKENAVPDEPIAPSDALMEVFDILTRGDKHVASAISACIADTEGYYASREEILDRHGLRYSPEAAPWLCVVAAVDAATQRGYLAELRPDCSPDDFIASLRGLLASADLTFSPDRLRLDPKKGLSGWIARFNEYAGQSGITLYGIEMYNGNPVIGAAGIADYAEAAETAGFAGVQITCRPC